MKHFYLKNITILRDNKNVNAYHIKHLFKKQADGCKTTAAFSILPY